jgi:hypothetical protein
MRTLSREARSWLPRRWAAPAVIGTFPMVSLSWSSEGFFDGRMLASRPREMCLLRQSPTAGHVRADRVNTQRDPRASFERHAATAHPRLSRRCADRWHLRSTKARRGRPARPIGWIHPVHVRGLRAGSAGSPTQKGAYLNSTRLPLKGKLDKGRQTPSNGASLEAASPPREARANIPPCFARRATSDKPIIVGFPYPEGKWHTAPPLSTEEADGKGTCAIHPLCQPPGKVARRWQSPLIAASTSPLP